MQLEPGRAAELPAALAAAGGCFGGSGGGRRWRGGDGWHRDAGGREPFAACCVAVVLKPGALGGLCAWWEGFFPSLLLFEPS